MSDEADIANDYMAADLDARIAAARGLSPRPGEGVPVCEECGSDVQPARVAAGYRVCLDCARDRERRANYLGGAL